MLFKYRDKNNIERTVEAASPQEAMAKAPNIHQNSGVEMVEGKDAKPDRTLPGMEEVGGRDLPQDEETPTGAPGRLGSLSEALTKAVDLGRQKRNRLLTQVVGTAFGGSLRARDFAGVLDSASAVSERTFDTILDTYNKSNESEDPNIITSTDDSGTMYGIDKNTGEVIWTRMGIGDGTEGPTDVFSKTDKQLLTQAGLSAAEPRVQVAFLRGTPDQFKQDWIRNNAADGLDNSGTAFEDLYNDLAAWEQMYKPSTGDPRTDADDTPLFTPAS